MRFFVGFGRAALFPLVGGFGLAPIGGTSASAEVVQRSDQGFVVRSSVEVDASPQSVWATLAVPSAWWDAEHSFSGAAANFSLELSPGGCFCEKLPTPQGSKGGKPGGVAHMRVVYLEPNRVMRLSGALGPLQSEAVNGVWTITLKAVGAKTRVLFEYVVGGYMRYTTEQIAPVVDKVLAAQLLRLAKKVDSSLSLASVPAAKPSAGPEGEGKSAPSDAEVVGPKLPQSSERAMAAPLAPENKQPPRSAKLAPALSGESASITKLVGDLDGVMGKTKLLSAQQAGAPPRPSTYVFREQAVRKAGPHFVLVDPSLAEAPRKLTFASTSGEARFRKEFAELSQAAHSLICQCTGSIEDINGEQAFRVIDAKLVAR